MPSSSISSTFSHLNKHLTETNILSIWHWRRLVLLSWYQIYALLPPISFAFLFSSPHILYRIDNAQGHTNARAHIKQQKAFRSINSLVQHWSITIYLMKLNWKWVSPEIWSIRHELELALRCLHASSLAHRGGTGLDVAWHRLTFMLSVDRFYKSLYPSPPSSLTWFEVIIDFPLVRTLSLAPDFSTSSKKKN